MYLFALISYEFTAFGIDGIDCIWQLSLFTISKGRGTTTNSIHCPFRAVFLQGQLQWLNRYIACCGKKKIGKKFRAKRGAIFVLAVTRNNHHWLEFLTLWYKNNIEISFISPSVNARGINTLVCRRKWHLLQNCLCWYLCGQF